MKKQGKSMILDVFSLPTATGSGSEFHGFDSGFSGFSLILEILLVILTP